MPLHSVIGMNAPENEEENAPKPLPQPTFQVAPGFEVRLFAESPLLAKPIQMNFDAKGRLWVASSAVYPQILPGEKADDKILILEDTNGDGRADKSTVFASGLMIPTTVIPGDDGAYVGQSTELLHFTDRDGDGHADEKKIILSGFGTEDTHHMVHTLRWGPDGRLYFNQSIYIHTHIETPQGVERLNSGGVWRFDPATAELSVFLRGFCNPWGHEIDEFGQSFETDGAGYQGISYGIRGATYFTYAIMRRELPSISPGNYPKFCSLELIRTPQFPPDWQGSAITCDFRAHRVVRFDIEEKGAGYAAHEVADLLRSTNVTFRPIDVKLGPDGALYVADWANPIIQHGEVDFRDPRRDHEHGRIWRITAKDRPALPRRDLTRASNWELLDLLIGSPEGEEHIGQNGLPEGLNTYDQQQARRVLAERGLSIRKDLGAWTRARRSDFAQLQALWLYESLDVVEPKLLERVLHAKDGRVRAAATRVAGFWHGGLPNALDLLAERVADDHPRVRLEAVRALAEIPTAHSAALVLSALDKPMDSFLDYAVWLSINDLANPWLESVKRGDWRPEGHEHQLEFALKALEPSLATTVLGKVMENRALSSDGKGPWIELIGSGGNSKLLRRLFDQAVAGGFDSGAVTRVFKALNTAARERGVKPEGSLGNLAALLDGKGAASKVPLTRAGRVELLRLAGNWKLTECIPQLAAAANSDALGMEERRAALDALRDIGGAKAIETLARLGNRNNFALRREAVERLAPLDIERASAPAVSILTNSISDDDATELWRALLSAKNAGPVLAHALPKSGLSAGMAKAGLRVAREGNRNEPDLVWALTRGAGLEDASQTLSDAELKALAADAMQRGDPARGERIFRRADMACIKCHSIGGVGGKVGPDLTSVGASAQPDYLVESVLYPNRKIKEG
ncbi:MAG TPA: PVC-type heme-binding CxxCH protein, partial [Verrucomicrobiae bacterium]|nr:PVC-type heme-binding CxxCH protein [Verrucomicrobiae bacterium]